MDEWDQEKLEQVVNQKHGTEKPSNQTDIICKFFLEAVEKKQYGWCASASGRLLCLMAQTAPCGRRSSIRPSEKSLNLFQQRSSS